jgi:predicted CxxxxCH...CXXCH cytochrome family protein
MQRSRALGVALAVGVAFAAAVACSSARDRDPAGPVWRDDVSSVVARRCVGCHSGVAPEGGWSATTFLDAIGCVAGDVPATSPRDSAPILRALGDATHAAIGTADERARIAQWVNTGAPSFAGSVHAPSFVDPRSPDRHGAFLRARRWQPMLDPTSADACGRCHDGAPTRPKDVKSTAPGATACTECHREPGGALGCGTCHGDGNAPSLPRTRCFFPNDAARTNAHSAHTRPSAARPNGLPCSTCHPTPNAAGDVIGGSHATGAVEIVFDEKAIGGAASWDRATGTCTVACHDRGGARPRPAWTETAPMGCNDCHSAPPKAHYPGACSACHADANASGTAITGTLHVNGKVDLGDGSGGCGACHGKGDDPWPSTGAHPRHRAPETTGEVACGDCHVVPPSILAGNGHLDGTVQVTFAGNAKARGAVPSWDKPTCTGVACHGARLPETPPVTPTWAASAPGGRCGDCHGLPPTAQHTTSTSCERSECHGSEVERGKNQEPLISTLGRSMHVDGKLTP